MEEDGKVGSHVSNGEIGASELQFTQCQVELKRS